MSELSEIAIIIQCITYNPSSLQSAKERKDTLPNPRTKPSLREQSSGLESKNINIPSHRVATLCSALDQTLLTPGKARAKREGKLSPGLGSSQVLTHTELTSEVHVEVTTSPRMQHGGHSTHSSQRRVSRPHQVGHVRHS